jgi:hypothetical protein
MEKMSQNTIRMFNIQAEHGSKNRNFDPLETQPIDIDAWSEHVLDKIEHDKESGEVVATATICEVSYYNDETGETDIRYEARYEKVE